jgi:glutaredoxin
MDRRASERPGETPLSKSVKMFTTSWCGYCVGTKRYLQSKGVQFEEIDIEQQPEYGEKIEQLTGGFRTVPTVEIDGKLMVNPSRREIDEALQA